MSTQQIFSFILGLMGIVGIAGASKLPMTRTFNIGPGAMPLFYSVVLLGLSCALFVKGRNAPKVNWRGFMKPPLLNGVVFYGLNFAMFGLAYWVGSIGAMFLFTAAALFAMKKLSVKQTVAFSVLWIGAVYVVFDMLLKIPFETGVLFLDGW